MYINDGVELPMNMMYLAAALGTAPLRRAVSAPADGLDSSRTGSDFKEQTREVELTSPQIRLII